MRTYVYVLAAAATLAVASAMCHPNSCGNGVLESTEACDASAPPSLDNDVASCSDHCTIEYDLSGCYRHSDWTDERLNNNQGWWFKKNSAQIANMGLDTQLHIWTDGAPYNWPTFFEYSDTMAVLSGVVRNENLSSDRAFCVHTVMDIIEPQNLPANCNTGLGGHCDATAGYTFFSIREDESFIKVCGGPALDATCPMQYNDDGGKKPGRWGPGGNVLENGNPDFGLSTWLKVGGGSSDINIDLDPCPQFPSGCPGFAPDSCYDAWQVQNANTNNGGFVIPSEPSHALHNTDIDPLASTFELCVTSGIAKFDISSAQANCSVNMVCSDLGFQNSGAIVYGNDCDGELICDGVAEPIKGKEKYGKEFYCYLLNGEWWCGTWFSYGPNFGKYGDIEWTPSCPDICGDGVTSLPDEKCDFANAADPNFAICRDDSFGEAACTYCGDGEVQFGLETCDGDHPECDDTCNNRPQFPGCVEPFTDATICGADYALMDYTAAGGLQVRNSFWPGEWTVLNFAPDLASDFDYCAPDSPDGPFEFAMSGEVRHGPSGQVCEFEYSCDSGAAWPGVPGGYGLTGCGGTLTCGASDPTLTLTPKSNAEGFEATIHTKWGVTSISAWVCYPSKNHDGEFSDLDSWAACGDIIATPFCPE